MTIIKKLKEKSRANQIAQRLSITREKAEDFLHLFGTDLEDYIKKTICCLGLEQIDEADERKEVTEKLLVAIGKAIPSPYSLAWPILKPVVRSIISELIAAATQQGEKFCEGVACTILPLRITV